VTYLKNIETFQAIGVRENPVLGLAHIYLRVNSALTQLGWLPRIFTLFIYIQTKTNYWLSVSIRLSKQPAVRSTNCTRKLILKNMFGHFFIMIAIYARTIIHLRIGEYHKDIHYSTL
jgi:hypothetical protein